MGNGQYGLARASDYYFGRGLASFTAEDADKAALLAGAIKLHPFRPVWAKLSGSPHEIHVLSVSRSEPISQLDLRGPRCAASQIKSFEDLMLQYAHGTRFNWTDLLAGNVEDLKKDFTVSSESSPKAVNVLTALSHLAKRDQRYRDVEMAYAMLSDFAHPNMASHATVVEMPMQVALTGQCKLAVPPGPLRGEFIMVLSAPWVSTGVGTSVELLIEVAPILQNWVDYIDGGCQATFDFAS